MSSRSQHTKQTSQATPQQMVHWFVASSYASGSFTEERVKNSISLLNRVPAAKNAVLQRFATLFEEAVRAQLDHMEFQSTATGVSSEMSSSLDLVVRALFEILETNGKSWALILSQWSVEALGQISSCNKQHQVVPPPSNLARLLNFWLGVTPMRMLLDVYRLCLKILIKSSPESCVGSLLATSTSHSPHFDWVVVDVGSAFPEAIIERVITTGFSKFCKLRWTSVSLQPSASITMQESEQTILTTVSRILEHLVSVQNTNICKKMFDMFKFPPPGPSCSRIKVSFYLMNLLSTSLLLLRSTTSNFVEQINAEMLNELYKEFQKLSKSGEELESTCSLITHLVCQSSIGSHQLILLFLNASCSKPPGKLQGLDKSLRSIFAKIMNLLLTDLKQMALQGGFNKENVFDELIENYTKICDDILNSNSTTRKQFIQELLVSMCVYKSKAPLIMSYILKEARTTSHLEIFLRLYADSSPVIPGILESTLRNAFASIRNMKPSQMVCLLKNVDYLMTSDQSPSSNQVFRTRLTKSLLHVFDQLIFAVGNLRNSIECSHAAVDVIYFLMINVSHEDLMLGTRLIPLTQSLVCYFFKLLKAGYVNNDKEMQSCHRIFVQLTQTSDMFAVVCRMLLEGSFGVESRSVLFGRKMDPDFNEDDFDQTDEHRETIMTQQQGSTVNLTSTLLNGFEPITYETGIIGGGPKEKKKCPISNMSQRSNNESLSLLIHRCSCKTSGRINFENFSIPDVTQTFDADKLLHISEYLMTAITVASPELATTLTLDGDLGWQSCSMKSMTIERDLKIFHFLDEHPFVWQLISLVAHNHRAFNKLSPLLRSCLSVLLCHCESSRYSKPLEETSLHYKVAVKVIDLLGKGQLLPEPICCINQIFHQISPYEVSVLLTTVWNFIKEHPSDSEASLENTRNFANETINLQSYLNVIFQVLHANITKLGPMVAKFRTPDK